MPQPVKRFGGATRGNGWVVELAGAPSDNTTLEAVLASFAQEGYTVELWARAGGSIMCGACSTTSPATDFEIGSERRMEGASDPADMQLVVGATCPACGERGVLSLHYGPTASEEDADILVALPR